MIARPSAGTVPAADWQQVLAKGMSEDRLYEKIRAIVVKDLAYAGGRIYHTRRSDGSYAGFPDTVILIPRLHVAKFWELKTQTGTVKPDQRGWLDDLLALGFDAAVIRPMDLITGRVARELTGQAP